jgi:hypothetical protein
VFRRPSADGAEFAVVTRGDALDFYQGRKTVTSFSVEPSTALRLACWLFWTWWVAGTWCGLKLLVWTWAFRYRLKERLAQRRGDNARA